MSANTLSGIDINKRDDGVCMSAAIPIVRPPPGVTLKSGNDAQSGAPSSTGAATAGGVGGSGEDKKLCRNVLIYGHCKFEQKGCMYAHPSSTTSPAPEQQKPSTGTSKLSAAQVVNAPTFVPSFGTPTPAASSVAAMSSAAKAHEFVPRREHTPALSEDAAFYSPPNLPQGQNQAPSYDGYQQLDGLAQYYGQMDVAADYPKDMYDYSRPGQQQQVNSVQPHQDYYAQHYHQPRQPLQYHLYHPPPPSVPAKSFFLPPSLHTQLMQQSEAIQAVSTLDIKLPEDVGDYTDLVLQTAPGPGGGEWSGWKTRVYKAWRDGKPWALRRIEGFRPQNEQGIVVVDKWTRVRHPGIVSIREAFTTRAFGDSSLVFVTDFHPLTTTLHDLHFSPLPSLPQNPWLPPSHPFAQQGVQHHRIRGGMGGGPNNSPAPGSGGMPHGVPEKTFWSYIVQLVAAIKLVHSRGLAVRNLEPGRILVTGKNRVRLAGHAVHDVLLGFDQSSVPAYQQDDLLALGKLICAMATGSLGAYSNLQVAVEHVSRSYPSDVKNLVIYLLSKPSSRKTIDEVSMMISNRTNEVLEEALWTNDTFEGLLSRELENGRLVRLVTKLGFINERPEFDHDPRWAETGDRYIIKLFRDYVFHQVDENGRPVTDLTHVLTCLNKLDAGVDEKIMLVSRDELNCLIVTYREVKNCIEAAFLDLSR